MKVTCIITLDCDVGDFIPEEAQTIIRQNLRQIVQRARDEGQFTGDSEVELDNLTTEITFAD